RALADNRDSPVKTSRLPAIHWPRAQNSAGRNRPSPSTHGLRQRAVGERGGKKLAVPAHCGRASARNTLPRSWPPWTRLRLRCSVLPKNHIPTFENWYYGLAAERWVWL